MSKIILPGTTTRIVLDPTGESTYNIPKGFYRYDIGEQWTLMDELGRINISWVYKYAMQLDPNITNKQPYTWLANKQVKVLRGQYHDVIGYDPVNTVNGGQRAASSQTQHTGSENNPTVNISANGNVQTYGTYMTDRMFVTYASWVSFDFKRYVDDIFLSNAGNAVTATGLVHSTDELHRENIAINSRHSELVRNIETVPLNLQIPDHKVRDIPTYLDLLRADYNLDITTEGFLKWLCWKGVFYKDGLRMQGDILDIYQPRTEFVNIYPRLFNIVVVNVAGKPCDAVYITEDGHNAMINDMINDFS